MPAQLTTNAMIQYREINKGSEPRTSSVRSLYDTKSQQSEKLLKE